MIWFIRCPLIKICLVVDQFDPNRVSIKGGTVRSMSFDDGAVSNSSFHLVGGTVWLRVVAVGKKLGVSMTIFVSTICVHSWFRRQPVSINGLNLK